MYYVCIECGDKAARLYKQYSQTVLKLWQCEKCGQPVDKYIEYDNSVLFMDAVLQKVPAFRHILYNSEFKALWKLGIVCLICDAYIKWTSLKHNQHRLEGSHFELEWTFYLMFLWAIAEYGIHILTVIACSWALRGIRPSNDGKVQVGKLFQVLLLANFGQLFVIPIVIIWGHNSEVYIWLTTLFIFLSNVQVYRAAFLVSIPKALFVIMAGFISKGLLLWHFSFESLFVQHS